MQKIVYRADLYSGFAKLGTVALGHKRRLEGAAEVAQKLLADKPRRGRDFASAVLSPLLLEHFAEVAEPGRVYSLPRNALYGFQSLASYLEEPASLKPVQASLAGGPAPEPIASGASEAPHEPAHDLVFFQIVPGSISGKKRMALAVVAGTRIPHHQVMVTLHAPLVCGELSCPRTQCSQKAAGNWCHHYDDYYGHYYCHY